MKLQVMVSDDLLERVDKLCAYIGASRSSVCAAIIAKSISEWEEIYYSPSVSQEVQKDSEH